MPPVAVPDSILEFSARFQSHMLMSLVFHVGFRRISVLWSSSRLHTMNVSLHRALDFKSVRSARPALMQLCGIHQATRTARPRQRRPQQTLAKGCLKSARRESDLEGLRLCLVAGLHVRVHMSVCLSIYLPIYLSICLSICLSIYLSIYPSIYLSIYLSICLSICFTIHRSICRSNTHAHKV